MSGIRGRSSGKLARWVSPRSDRSGGRFSVSRLEHSRCRRSQSQRPCPRSPRKGSKLKPPYLQAGVSSSVYIFRSKR